MLNPSELIFLVGFVVYVVIRGVFEQKTKAVATIESRFDAVEGVLLGFVMLGSLILPLVYLFSALLDCCNYAQPEWLMWIGSVVMVAALWLFWRSHVDLGINWSAKLEIRAQHQLVTAGVYRRVRHPMYAAIFLFGMSQALLLGNYLAGLSALVTFIPLYWRRVAREEQMMMDRFGDDYRDYCAQSGRLWPR